MSPAYDVRLLLEVMTTLRELPREVETELQRAAQACALDAGRGQAPRALSFPVQAPTWQGLAHFELDPLARVLRVTRLVPASPPSPSGRGSG
jgi:hypothetical protein